MLARVRTQPILNTEDKALEVAILADTDIQEQTRRWKSRPETGSDRRKGCSRGTTEGPTESKMCDAVPTRHWETGSVP
jgi:hypothetical protein